MEFDTDLLDEYCQNTFGHSNWEFIETKPDHVIVKFNKEPLEEDEDEDEEVMKKFKIVRFNNYFTTSTISIQAKDEDEAYIKYKQGDYNSEDDERESSLQGADPMGGSEIEIHEVEENEDD